MRFPLTILLILSFHFSFAQESNNNKFVGVWTVIDAGITYFALCGSHDFSKTIGRKYEFLSSGQLKIHMVGKGQSEQCCQNLIWTITSENIMTIKSEDEQIDFGIIKYYFYKNKLKLDNNLVGLILEKNNLPQQRL